MFSMSISSLHIIATSESFREPYRYELQYLQCLRATPFPPLRSAPPPAPFKFPLFRLGTPSNPLQSAFRIPNPLSPRPDHHTLTVAYTPAAETVWACTSWAERRPRAGDARTPH
jgi:hypothetical protein